MISSSPLPTRSRALKTVSHEEGYQKSRELRLTLEEQTATYAELAELQNYVQLYQGLGSGWQQQRSALLGLGEDVVHPAACFLN
jgi:hypothetical protein